MTVIRDTKSKPSKAKKYLQGFEVWVGKKAGDMAVKCGGPFAWSTIKKGPVTTPCDAAKSKCVCRSLLVATRPTSPRQARQQILTSPSLPRVRHRYVTVILPGTRKTLAFGEIEVR